MFRKTKLLQLNSLQTIFFKSLDCHKYNNVSSSQFAPTVGQIIFIIVIKYANCKEVSKRFHFQSKIRFSSSIPTQRLSSVTCIFCLSCTRYLERHCRIPLFSVGHATHRIACVTAAVKRGRGRGNFGARERVGLAP